MDPFVGESTSRNTQQNNAHRSDLSNQETIVDSRWGTSRSGDTLRRGHSDGDVLVQGGAPFGVQHQGDGETWMDFLRYSGSGGDRQDQIQLAIRRAAMMAADRNRRLASYTRDNLRRRSSSNVTFPCGRARPGSPYTGITSVPTVLRRSSERYEEGVVDPPLLQTPRAGIQSARQSQEVAIPKWQPDNDVTRCPICNTSFTFWYRKHHCRKCGRVVCANCSPHRITIPRQFIVRPPEENFSSEPSTVNGVDVVDLTGDDEDHLPGARLPTAMTQNRGIDPSLGGGQEVRLCNPCVPDPNPLPHLDHASPRYTLDSFPRPESLPRRRSSSFAPRTSSLQRPLPPPPRGVPSTRSSFDRRPLPDIGTINGQLQSDLSDVLGIGAVRQRSHGSQSSVPSALRPNQPAVYGSAPDLSLHNVSTKEQC